MRYRSILMRVLTLFGFALVYIVAARLGLLLSYEGTNASPVWPPSGIAVAAVVLFGGWASPFIAIGAFIGNVWSFIDRGAADMEAVILMSAVISIGNMLEGLVGGMLLRKTTPGHPIQSISDVYRFLGIAAFVSLISAGFGNVSLFMGGVISPDSILQVMATWWVGDFVGIMVITPLCLLGGSLSLHTLRKKWRNVLVWVELVLSIAVVAVIALLIFLSGTLPLVAQRLMLFLFFPAAAWLAYRHGTVAVNPMILLVSTVAVLGTVQGNGPFQSIDLNGSLISLEVFVVLLTLAGMLFSADSVLLNSYESNERRRWVFRSHWLALLVALMGTIIGWHAVTEDTLAVYNRAFRFHSNEVVGFVTNRMVDYAQILRSAAGFFSSSEEVTRREWKRYFLIQEIERTYPGIQGLGFAAFVSEKNVDAFVAGQRAEGRADFYVRPVSDNAFRAPVTFLEPENARNNRAFGFDMYSEPNRRQAMDEAASSGEAAMSSLVTLVQETDQDVQPGMILYFPVYRQGLPVDTYEQKKRALQGFIYAPFRAHDMFRTALSNRLSEGDIRVWDGNVRTEETLLFQSAARVRENARFVFDGIVVIGNHSWSIELRSTTAFEATIDETKAAVFLIAGMIISMLLFTAMRSLTTTRAEALRFADNVGSALAEKNAFQQSILDSVDSAIVSVTVGGRITSFSRGAERLLGYRSDEVVGKRELSVFHDPKELEERAEVYREDHNTVVEPGFDLLVAGLGPHLSKNEEWTYLAKDGKRIPVFLTMSSITNREGLTSGYLAVARDLTSSKKTLEALRESEVFNRSIVDNTRDRIFIMDGKGIIIDAPRSTLEALGLGDALIAVGVEWSQLWKSDYGPAARAAFVDVVAGHTSKMQGKLNTIEQNEVWWDVVMSPMTDRNGKVEKVLAVLRDFTVEYERDNAVRKINTELEERIAERTRQLRESNILLKAHADELEERQRFLQTIADNIPVNIAYWSKSGARLAFANEGFYRWIDKAPGDVLNQTYEEIMPAPLFTTNKPFFDKAMLGIPQEVDRSIKDAAGEISYVWISYIPHFNDGEVRGLFSLGIDVTKTKRAEMEVQKLNEILQLRIKETSDELYATESLFSSAMTASSAGMAIIGSDNRWQRSNPALCNFLGYNEMDLAGKSMIDIAAAEDADLVRDVVDALWNGETFSARLEQRFVRQDGEKVWGLLNVARVVDSEGKTRHLVAHIADINQEKQLEQNMEALIEQLTSQKAELERSNKELDSFAYAASHDLKSPLRGIGNLAAWIEEDLGPSIHEDIRTNLQLMRKRIGQMEMLLQDLLTYAKAGKENEAWQAVDIEQKVQEIWGLTGGADQFVLEWESSIKLIHTPRVALEQILRNLVSNAIKHHDKDTGTIRISCEPEGKNVRFKVSDDGPGIKPEYHQKIFAMFQTLKSKDESRGSGIGLALVKKVVEHYGGTIVVESDGKKGTTFSFSWPAEIALS